MERVGQIEQKFRKVYTTILDIRVTKSDWKIPSILNQIEFVWQEENCKRDKKDLSYSWLQEISLQYRFIVGKIPPMFPPLGWFLDLPPPPSSTGYWTLWTRNTRPGWQGRSRRTLFCGEPCSLGGAWARGAVLAGDLHRPPWWRSSLPPLRSWSWPVLLR